MRAVTIAVVRVAADRDEVLALDGSPAELRVCLSNARVHDVHADALAAVAVAVLAVQRQALLVDAVETPRRAALCRQLAPLLPDSVAVAAVVTAVNRAAAQLPSSRRRRRRIALHQLRLHDADLLVRHDREQTRHRRQLLQRRIRARDGEAVEHRVELAQDASGRPAQRQSRTAAATASVATSSRRAAEDRTTDGGIATTTTTTTTCDGTHPPALCRPSCCRRLCAAIAFLALSNTTMYCPAMAFEESVAPTDCCSTHDTGRASASASQSDTAAPTTAEP
jgi:hypothetical protein